MKQQPQEIKIWTKKDIIQQSFKGQEFNVLNKYPNVTALFDTLEFLEDCNEQFIEVEELKKILLSLFKFRGRYYDCNELLKKLGLGKVK